MIKRVSYIYISKLAIQIETNSILYYIKTINPCYGLETRYDYSYITELEHFNKTEDATIMLEPFTVFLNNNIKYDYIYSLYSCDFFKEKRLHTIIPHYIFDEIPDNKILNIEETTNLIYKKHKDFLSIKSLQKGLNIINKNILKEILY